MGEKGKFLVKGISKLWGKGGEIFPDEINGYTLESGVYNNRLSSHDLNQNVLECVKCKDTSARLEPCNNCGSNTDLDFNRYSSLGSLYCIKCKRVHQQNRWVCTKCNCDNPILETLFHWVEIDIRSEGKTGCFVATTCYGNYDAPEVLALRQFRDDKLLKTFSGKVFVKFYYSVSPFLVRLISKSDLRKNFVRKFILEPIVTKLQRSNKG